MHFLHLTTLFGLVASNALPNIMPIFERGEGLNITQEEAHENVMASIPAEFIVNSNDLEAYIANHQGANYTIYLSDVGAFVDMATIGNAAPNDLQKRESGPCIAPQHYTRTYTKQAGQWYDAWHPASSCLWTGNSNAGGSQSLMSSSSLAIETSIELDYNVIKDILGLTLGITVTRTWSESKTILCTVKPNSVVQTWSQQYIAWGWFWSQTCPVDKRCGSCSAEKVLGGATAPAVNPNTGLHVNYGCSTGASKVKC